MIIWLIILGLGCLLYSSVWNHLAVCDLNERLKRLEKESDAEL